MAIPKVRIYKSGSSLVVKTGSKVLQVGSPSDFGVQYIDVSNSRANDKIAITYFGRVLLADKKVDDFVDESGEIISPDVQLSVLLDYFNSIGLGVGQPVDLSDYYTKAEVDAIVAAIYEAIGQPQPNPQLATPAPVTSNVTTTSITVSFPAVPFATTYEIRQNGTLVYTGNQTSRTFTGLQPDTMYTYSVIAKANGYINSLTGSVTATTQSTVPEPGNNQLPYILPFIAA
jgi:hypothetical protein